MEQTMYQQLEKLVQAAKIQPTPKHQLDMLHKGARLAYEQGAISPNQFLTLGNQILALKAHHAAA